MKISAFLLSITAVFAPLIFAEEKPGGALFVYEVFTLPKVEGLALLAAQKDLSETREAAVKALAAGTAKLEILMAVNSSMGTRSTLSQVGEFWYPTEFDPQESAQELLIAGDLNPLLIKALESATAPPPEPPPAPTPPPPPEVEAKDKNSAEVRRNPVNGGLGIITCITPTTFEMKELGQSLVVEPTVKDDKGAKISLELTPTFSRFLGEVTYNTEPQPVFAVRTSPRTVNVVPGKSHFLGTISAASNTGAPHDDKPETLSLAFITAHTPPAKEAGRAAPVAEQTLTWKLQIYSMERAVAHNVLTGQPTGPDALTAVSAAGKLEAIHIATTNPGQRLAISEVHEFWYPTEFDPPEMPQKLWIANTQLLDDLRSGRQVGLGLPPKTLGASSANGGFGLMTTTSPTTFEMKPLGTSIEADISDGANSTSVSVSIDLTRLIDEIHYTDIPQPVFECQKLITSVSPRIDAPILLGTLSKPLDNGLSKSNNDDRVWLAFMTISDGW